MKKNEEKKNYKMIVKLFLNVNYCVYFFYSPHPDFKKVKNAHLKKHKY